MLPVTEDIAVDAVQFDEIDVEGDDGGSYDACSGEFTHPDAYHDKTALCNMLSVPRQAHRKQTHVSNSDSGGELRLQEGVKRLPLGACISSLISLVS